VNDFLDKPGKGHGYGHHKNPPPNATLCDSLPQAVGTVYSYDFEVGSYVFQISEYYTNPNPLLPIGDTSALRYTVNNIAYFTDKVLVWGDSANLASFSFGAAFAPSSFNNGVATSIVFGYIIGANCAPTQYTSQLSINQTALTTSSLLTATTKEGIIVKSDNAALLQYYLKDFDINKFRAAQKITLEKFQQEGK